MTLEDHFTTLEYLKSGTPRQRTAFDTLQSLNLFTSLKKYDPILVGTIPLDVDIPNSDLDIICTSDELNQFENFVLQEFGKHDHFRIQITKINGISSLIANFTYNNFDFELFCQSIPTRKQNAFIHMIVEERLLQMAGSTSRNKIRELKSKGLKTEPSFAALFDIPGDSYQALLDLYYTSDDELRKFVNRNLRPSTVK